MKTRVISVVFGAVLCVAQSAVAENPTIPTPEQKAITKQIRQLNDDADSALNAGKYDAAEADARKAMSLGWEGVVCQDDLAAALDAQGKDKEALQEYKEIADRGTSYPRELMPYALLLLKNGQYAQAAAAYNKAISIYDPRDLANVRGEFSPDTSQATELETAIHIELGRVWASGGVWGGNPNFTKALDQYEKALQLSPDNALANYYAGTTLKQLGLRTQAQVYYTKAAKLGNEDIRKVALDAMKRR